jgi:hypothetical protein
VKTLIALEALEAVETLIALGALEPVETLIALEALEPGETLEAVTISRLYKCFGLYSFTVDSV